VTSVTLLATFTRSCGRYVEVGDMTDIPSILKRTHALDGGPAVSLRLARLNDLAAVQALLRSRGEDVGELEVRRGLAYDPSECLVLVAIAGVDRLVGLGAIRLRDGADVHTLVTDEQATPGLGELLGTVLRAQAQTRARRAA
jgi:hypothetical protein